MVCHSNCALQKKQKKKPPEDTEHIKRNGQIMIHWSLEVQKRCDEANGGGSLLILFLCLTRDLSTTWPIPDAFFFYFLNVRAQQVVNMKSYFFHSPLPGGLQ